MHNACQISFLDWVQSGTYFAINTVIVLLRYLGNTQDSDNIVIGKSETNSVTSTPPIFDVSQTRQQTNSQWELSQAG